MTKIVTANASATGGREGRIQSEDKQIDFAMSMPGSGKPGVNPEQLFAAGYAACFGGAVQAVARMEKLEVGQVEVKSSVELHKEEATGFQLAVTLNVALPTLDQDAAEKVVAKAHTVCPYSKAIHGNVEVTLQVNGQSLAQAA